MVAAMLGARAVEGAAAALLRLLLLLLPALSGPGLGVVGSAGAGLPESVIWAVNAGGEAHVDVHGIHFRKDPLEGRVGRGESPSPSRGAPGLWCGGSWPRAAGPAPLPRPGGRVLERSFSAVSSGTRSQLTARPGLETPPRATEAETWRKVTVGPRRLPFLNPEPREKSGRGRPAGTSRPRGCRLSVPPARGSLRSSPAR